MLNMGDRASVIKGEWQRLTVKDIRRQALSRLYDHQTKWNL